jgi:phenylacetate-CoA ligase
MASLPMQTKPKALLSTAMMLTTGLRQHLETRFECPMFDFYSMNESGPIAIADGDSFKLLHHRIYVEILDAEGAQCPAGVRGEVVLTGGFNPFLPLLRYRTNDYASLEFHGRQPVLVGLEGRKPVLFRTNAGQVINSLDVNVALRPFALPQFTLHQTADGILHFRMLPSAVSETQVRQALLSVFGVHQQLRMEVMDTFGDKVIQYTNELELAL